MNGIGGGYLSENMLACFPFEDGQCLSWGSDSPEFRNEMQVALNRCFVDAGMYIASEFLSEGTWPSIGDLSAGASSISFKIHAEGNEIPLTVSSSGEKFPIVSGPAPWGHYVVVLSSEGIGDFCSLCRRISAPLLGQDSSSPVQEGGRLLRLCARCITLRPRSVESIRVFDGVKPFDEGPHFVMRGDVSIKPGNNFQLLESEDNPNGFEIAAVPGAGLGRLPCVCGDNPPGGNSLIAGPDGHARLFNDTCYDLEPGPKYYKYIEKFGREMLTQDIRFHVKCTACCTCDMYEHLVNDRLAAIADAIRAAKMGSDGEGGVRNKGIDELLQDYESAVWIFNERMSRPSLSDVSMTLSAMPIGKNVSPKMSGTSVSGNMSRCAYTAVIRNSSYFRVIATITSMSGTDTIVEASASWSDEEGEPLSRTGDSESEVMGESFTIYPGRSLVVTYISSKSEKVSEVFTGGFTGSMSVDMSYESDEGSGYLGMISRTVEA